MHGGAIYGEGVHGRVIDIVSKDRKDTHTLLSFIEAHRDSPICFYSFVAANRVVTRVADPGSREYVDFVSSISNDGGNFVVKMFKNKGDKKRHRNVTSKQAFEAEIATNYKVKTAFKSKLQTYTTLVGSQKPFAGFEIADTYFVMNQICEHGTLEKHAFESFEKISKMIEQILDIFEIIHGAQLVHADVKPDNIGVCDDKKGRFKLIDWGATATIEEISQIYAASRTPRNFASPLAWFAWGLTDEKPTGLEARTFSKVVHARIGRRQGLYSYDRYREFVGTSFESYSKFLNKLYVRRDISGLDENVRKAVLKDYVPSFDIYNFGVVIMGVALSLAEAKQVPQSKLDILIEFATRLTHYAHPEYAGISAMAAKKAWKSLMD